MRNSVKIRKNLSCMCMLLCLLLVATALAACDSTHAGESTWLSAVLDEEDVLWIPVGGGKVKSLTYAYDSALITPDRKTVLAGETNSDGQTCQLYYMSVKDQKATPMLNEGSGETLLHIGMVGNACAVLLITDKQALSVRAVFYDSGETVTLHQQELTAENPDGIPLAISDGETAVAYLNENTATLCVVTGEAKRVSELIRVSVTEDLKILAVSDSGKSVVWLEDSSLKLYADGKVSTVARDVEHTEYRVVFDAADRYAILECYEDNTFLVCRRGEEAVVIRPGKTISDYCDLYTDKGLLTDDGSGSIKGFYTVLTDNGQQCLYYLTLTGEETRVKASVDDCQIVKGQLYYTAGDVLYTASVSGGSVGDAVQIARDVDGFLVTENGKYAVYGKGYALYMYSLKQDESERIAADCGEMYLIEGSSQTIYYIAGVDITGHYAYGDLYSYTFGKGSQKIDSDVMIGTLDSGKTGNGQVGLVTEKSFYYHKYQAVDGNTFFTDLYSYNGRTCTRVVQDVKYD